MQPIKVHKMIENPPVRGSGIASINKLSQRGNRQDRNVSINNSRGVIHRRDLSMGEHGNSYAMTDASPVLNLSEMKKLNRSSLSNNIDHSTSDT